MSILYKESPKTSVSFKKQGDKVQVTFSSDGFKFGTEEVLDEFLLSPDKLLTVLQAYDDYSQEEREEVGCCNGVDLIDIDKEVALANSLVDNLRVDNALFNIVAVKYRFHQIIRRIANQLNLIL